MAELGTVLSDGGISAIDGNASDSSHHVVQGNRQKLSFNDFYVPTFRLTIRG